MQPLRNPHNQQRHIATEAIMERHLPISSLPLDPFQPGWHEVDDLVVVAGHLRHGVPPRSVRRAAIKSLRLAVWFPHVGQLQRPRDQLRGVRQVIFTILPLASSFETSPRQWQRNGGRCGVCGDPYDEAQPRAGEGGGK